MQHEDGIFHHKCKDQMCDKTVVFDDEPYCFKHSPDSGSSQRGYSARAEAEMRNSIGDGVVSFAPYGDMSRGRKE